MVSLSEKAYDHLKSLILSNALQAGRYLLEDEVVELLSMSRTPLREALIRLEHDGLITIIPRRGIRIQTLRLDDVIEIYTLLEAVEALAIKSLAVSSHHEEHGQRLLDIVDQMDEALERDDLPQWAQYYSHFHTTLVGITGMARLQKLASTLLDQSHRVRIFTLKVRERPVNVNQNQRTLALDIRSGDLDAALKINALHALGRIEEIAALFLRLSLTEL